MRTITKTHVPLSDDGCLKCVVEMPKNASILAVDYYAQVTQTEDLANAKWEQGLSFWYSHEEKETETEQNIFWMIPANMSENAKETVEIIQVLDETAKRWAIVRIKQDRT